MHDIYEAHVQPYGLIWNQYVWWSTKFIVICEGNFHGHIPFKGF